MNLLGLVTVAAGVLGLLVGSFLNVVIWRVPRHESVLFPASHCPMCETPIKARHNAPVLSWLWLRRRCASCQTPISARYPSIELLTGLLFVAVALRAGVSAALPGYLFLAAAAITLAAIDLDGHRLPDTITVPTYVVGAALLVTGALASDELLFGLRAAVGLVVFLALYLAAARLFGRTLDTRVMSLAAAVGLLLGGVSWVALVVAAVAVLIFATVAMIIRNSSVGGMAAAMPMAFLLLTATGVGVLSSVS